MGDVVFDIKNVSSVCQSFVGESEVPYPWFSSRTVNGKPLHEWAKEFALDDEDEIENGEKEELLTRPMTKLSIKSIDLMDFYMIPSDVLIDNVKRRISKVKGDFRQDDILNKWDEISIKKKSRKYEVELEYPILKIKVKCASGSYMRTLAELIGQKLNVPSLAYSIKRTSVGDYKI